MEKRKVGRPKKEKVIEENITIDTNDPSQLVCEDDCGRIYMTIEKDINPCELVKIMDKILVQPTPPSLEEKVVYLAKTYGQTPWSIEQCGATTINMWYDTTKKYE